MNRLLKIDNLMFKVNDLDKSTDFYVNILGLNKRWRDDNYKMVGFTFVGSDCEIVIHADPDLPKFDFSFLVENVTRFCEEFKQQGFNILREPFDVRPGKFAVLADPDGNEIPIIDLTKFGGVARYED